MGWEQWRSSKVSELEYREPHSKWEVVEDDAEVLACAPRGTELPSAEMGKAAGAGRGSQGG